MSSHKNLYFQDVTNPGCNEQIVLIPSSLLTVLLYHKMIHFIEIAKINNAR